MVGASGAISGVLAAYVVLHPRAPVLTLVPIPLALFVEVPAFVFIFVWFALQLVYGLLSTGGFSSGGVAWWAHIGGFLVGLFAILLHRKLLGGESSITPINKMDYGPVTLESIAPARRATRRLCSKR
jgi:membrane associated rhomboid family serine protease